VWLVVGRDRIAAFSAQRPEGAVSGPFDVKAIQKARTFQAVGGGVLQFKVSDFYNNAVRFVSFIYW
jgi:hypothetical protein